MNQSNKPLFDAAAVSLVGARHIVNRAVLADMVGFVQGARPVLGGLPSKREVEAAVRSVGLSARQAKKLIARGYNAIRQDDEPV